MKKFQDIKIRQKRPRVMDAESKHDEGFWHGFSESKTRFPLVNEKLKIAIAKGSLVTIILLFFFAFSLARAFDAKSKVEVLTENTKIYLDSAFTLLNDGKYNDALVEANKASDNLKEIKLNLQSWGQDLSYLSLISNKHSATVNLEMTLDAANMILNTISDSKTQLEQTLSQNFAKDSGNSSGKNLAFDISAASGEFEKTINNSYVKLDQSEKIIDRIDLDQLGSFKGSIEKAKSAIVAAKRSIELSKALVSKDLPWISAKDGEKRDILIIFQNNAELRGGSGGSFGSFGIAHFEDGKFSGIEFGTNIYKLDHAFEATTKIAPPEDLKWVVADGTWAMKDSGWAVDGPEAFDKIKFFYEAETGKKIDGIITIDTSAFVDILRLIGPIDLPEHKLTVDANNFESETEKEVHQTYFNDPAALAENEPKKFLAEMMPTVIDRLIGKLSDKETIFDLMKTFSDSFSAKHMMLYIFNQDIQNDFDKYNISGKVTNKMDDYLYINNSNLNGFKSSTNISEDITLDSSISADGTVANTLQINRKHNGSSDWPDGYNINLVRLLLPKDFKLTNFNPILGNFEQNGKEGYKNGQKYWSGTEAGSPDVIFWMNTQPKTESKVEVNYSFKAINLDNNFYSATFQRQPGASADNISYTIHFPDNLIPENLPEYDAAKHSASFTFQLTSDKTINIKLSKN